MEMMQSGVMFIIGRENELAMRFASSRPPLRVCRRFILRFMELDCAQRLPQVVVDDREVDAIRILWHIRLISDLRQHGV